MAAPPADTPPPPYSQVHEMQDPGEYMYPGDTNVLIAQEPSEGHKNPPAPPYGPISSNNWPEGGGYVHNAQPGYPYAQQPGYPVAQPGYPVAQPGYPVAQPGYPVAQPVPQNQVVLVQQGRNCENGVRTYIRWRLYICLIVFVVKIIIIAIVLGILFGSDYNY